ncbi:MAG: TetR/AcrR family transcriptional regulator [Propionibacteriaceae bacterium]|nr:TetR/AcrR family transcriptional regulator [Propionibacteriaceae bacterium]
MRGEVLDVARRLTLETGAVPSLNAIVAAAGVSKGGMTHHFPTRAALVAGLARMALEEVDEEMSRAAIRGDATRTWLRLSMPQAVERALMQALVVELRTEDPVITVLLADARDAVIRWERTIEAEVGDPVQARVIRLVGDALVANAVAGIESEPPSVDELQAFLTRPLTSDASHP